jgi:acyl-coenzyme A synthetase/AMP-(fatty) acid ligase
MRTIVPISALLAQPRPDEDDGAGRSAALLRDVGLLAARIRGQGGVRWLIVSEDAGELAAGLLAALHAGAAAVLPANLQPGHLRDVAQGVDGAILGRGQAVESAGPTVSIGAADLGQEALPLTPLDPDRAMIRLHTSGTTGAPVAIDKPLRCLEAELSALEAAFAHLSFRTVLATVPPYHIYGLLFRVLWPLAAGRSFARDTIRFPGELASTAASVPDPLLVTSPAFLKRALGHVDLGHLGQRLRGLFSSGGPLPPAVAAAYNKVLAHPVVEVYGSTETGGIGHRTVRDADAPAPWSPLPGVKLAIDPDLGALKVASPFIAGGGWHRTADVADLAPNGQFSLHGRADRIVKVEERRISLLELEQRLAFCPEVAAARVLRLGDGESGRVLLGAVIVPSAAGWSEVNRGGKGALKNRLLAALRPHVDAVALPRRWRFVRRLPETAQGKTSDAELTKLFAPERDDVSPIVLDRATEEGGLRLTLRLEPELLYFDGHFDIAPILAGVVQLDWAIAFGKEHFAIREPFRRIEALKFFDVILADQQVVLDLRYDAAKGRLHFRYGAGERDCSAGRIMFGAAA